VKIAITGHTSGIGAALAKVYAESGHEIVGLSKRDGNNIRNTPKICDQIEDCDLFVNNAQAGYAQTELLFEMAKRWTGTKKHIISISTMMTQQPVSSIPGLGMDQYRIQKLSLEQAVHQLRNRALEIQFTIVRPGNIATSSDKTVPPAADTDVWARVLVSTLNTANSNNLVIPDISLGPA
jgi:NADP-dependent 3-hydroxy acid dehydrogenase YdfG